MKPVEPTLLVFAVICLGQTVCFATTEGHIEMSLDPQPALIGEDVGIRCTVMQVPVQPRIAVNDKEETIHTLTNRDKYTLTSSTITNGVAVYVLTLHNVSVSDNGTRFECYVRSSGSRITSGTRVLRVVQERISVNKDILTTTKTTSEEISIASSSESPTFPLRTINTYEWPIPTTTTATTTTTTKAHFATPITKPTATPVQPTPAITGGPSQIRISLDPQPALIGEDVRIRCTVKQIPVQPRIAVNDKDETIHTLANRDKYTLTSSTITNGVAVYVLTLHNVSVSDNGTRFECYVRSSGSRITSGTRVLRVIYKDILMTTTTTTTTTKLEEISIASSSENPTFPLRTINTYEWPIPTTTTATTTTTTKANFATPITKPTATPVQPTPAMLGQTSVSIEGGGRVEVGDNVSIICLCTGNFNCYSHGVVFRISGRDYTYSQLKEHVPQYSIRHGDTSLRKQEVVLTLTQATLDNDGTTYKCKIFPDNWDQANMVTLSVIGGPSTVPTAPPTVKGSLYTTDLSEIVSTHVLTPVQSTFRVSPTILVAPETSTVELYAILIPAGVLVALLVISLLIIMIVSLVLVKRRRHERGINELEIEEILEERKENSYVM